MKALPDGVTGPVQGEQVEPAIIHVGDCLEVLRTLPDCSVDSIVTDPPYGLGKEPDALAMLADWLATGHHDVKGSGFMGKTWDAFVPQPALWRECLRVLKPGGHLLAFAGTRTHDLMTLGLRIAGFEIRDTIMWVYGSGFPKSLDVSKAIDKAAGAEREVVGSKLGLPGYHLSGKGEAGPAYGSNLQKVTTEQRAAAATITAPATDEARQWEGWGTALKPALEPITVARKPLIGTVAENVLAHGTGALNIDACRVESGADYHDLAVTQGGQRSSGGILNATGGPRGTAFAPATGRWPANLIHDGSDEVVGLFPHTVSGSGNKNVRNRDDRNAYGKGLGAGNGDGIGGDAGSAARFFYCAKASKKDRDEGLEGFDAKPAASTYGDGLNTATKVRTAEQTANGVSRDLRRNTHPTVKPTALMRYLCRLVTPPGGVVLDPFAGSGSTGKAAMAEGFRFIGCELDPDYAAIARARIEAARAAAARAATEAEAAGPSQELLFA